MMSEDNTMPATEARELRLQESESDSQQVLGHQEESILLLRHQLNELKKTLEDKENKLIEAKEIIGKLRNEVQTLQQQLEEQKRLRLSMFQRSTDTPDFQLVKIDSQKIITPIQACPVTPSVLKTSTEHNCSELYILPKESLEEQSQEENCMSESPQTETSSASDHHGDDDPNPSDSEAGDTDAEGSPERSHKGQDVSAQSPLQSSSSEADCALRTAACVSPLDLQLSCNSENDPADPVVCLSDGGVSSSQSSTNGQGMTEQSTATLKSPAKRRPCRCATFRVRLLPDPHMDKLCRLKAEASRKIKVPVSLSAKEFHDVLRDAFPKLGNTDFQLVKVDGHKRITPIQASPVMPSVLKASSELNRSALYILPKEHLREQVEESQERQHAYVSPPSLFLSYTSEDNPADPSVSLHDGAGRSPQQGPLRLVTVTLKDCREMLGPNGVYKIPTEDGNHDGVKCDYEQHGEDDEDRDFDPRSESKAGSPRNPHENKDKMSNSETARAKPHKCGECGKVFSFPSQLVIHQRLHAWKKETDPGASKNPKLSKTPASSKEKNLKGVQQKPCECTECGKMLSSQTALSVHKRLHTGARPYACVECSKTFTQRVNLLNHQRIHTQEKPHQCAHCPLRFVSSSKLKVHTRVHTGEKPYPCGQCTKVFRTVSGLKSHQAYHTDERPFLCLQCGSSFKTKHGLAEHDRTHTGEKPYLCHHCGKTFVSSSKLALHQRSHTGEKPYMCSVCGKCFNNSTILTNHKRRHTGEKPFICDVCGKRFARVDALGMHMRIHTRDKPYECIHCGQAFPYKKGLLLHQKNEHVGGQMQMLTIWGQFPNPGRTQVT